MSLARNLMRFSSRQIRILPRQLALSSQNSSRYETVAYNSFITAPTNHRSFSTENPRDVQKEIGDLVVKNKVVVFMKGVPEAPRCGFSNAVVQIMRMHDVTYDAHNVLEDEEIRQGIKDFSNWPTIPQVYMEGEFIGGCDILLQMHQSGELVEELQKIGIKSALLPPEEENK